MCGRLTYLRPSIGSAGRRSYMLEETYDKEIASTDALRRHSLFDLACCQYDLTRQACPTASRYQKLLITLKSPIRPGNINTTCIVLMVNSTRFSSLFPNKMGGRPCNALQWMMQQMMR